MYPVINELKKSFVVKSLNTRQHQELLDGLMNHYHFTPDHTLDVMKKGQSLNELSSKILSNVDQILKLHFLKKSLDGESLAELVGERRKRRTESAIV